MNFDGFIGPSYSLEVPTAAAQRAVNIYPEVHEAGPRKGNVARFRGTPGLRKRVTLADGPIRGVYWSSTGQLFVVSGSNLYEITSAWAASLRSGVLASSTGRVTMADNGTYLMIGDGGAQAHYASLTFGGPLHPITDPDCPGGHVTWQDGYFINTVPNSGRFQLSGLYDITYDALDVATTEGRPDPLAFALSTKLNLWLFGTQTTEVWWNSGNAAFPFERIQNAFIETGTLSALTCARVAESVAWLGNDERGRGTVWYAQGFQPTRISTHGVEQGLKSCANLNQAWAFAYQQGGHEFYQLSVPASSTDSGGTWVFDFSTKQWHERSYLGATGEGPHRASCATSAFGEVVVGDYEDGRLYTLDSSYYSDDGQPIRRMRQCPHITNGEQNIVVAAFQLQCEAGVGLPTGQGSNPVAVLQWSDDGGHTWSNEHEASLGAQGKYFTRVKWRRLGKSRDRVFRVVVTDPVPISWLGVELDVEQLGR